MRAPLGAVPTLTEVVGAAELQGPAAANDAPAPRPGDEDAALMRAVLVNVQRQIDLMLEYRLREALAPVVARLTEALLDEARTELASTLRDVVARAVAQESARQRHR